MKITRTTIIPAQQNPQQVQHKPSFGSNFDGDTFSKPINAQIADEVIAEQSRKILENPTLLQNFSKFVSDGLANAYLKLAALAYGSLQTKRQPDNIQTKTNEDSEKIKSEIDSIKECNARIEEKLDKILTVQNAKPANVVQTQESFEAKTEDITTPKNRAQVESIVDKYSDVDERDIKCTKIDIGIKGNYSLQKRQFVEFIKTLNVPVDSAEKLKVVCFDVIRKGTPPERISVLQTRLEENQDNKKQLAKIIEQYYDESDLQIPDEQVREEVVAPTVEQAPTRTYTIKPPKVVGKIDIDTVDSKKPKNRFRNPPVKAEEIERVFAPSVDMTKNFFRLRDKLPSYVCDTETSINELLKHFKKTVNPDYKDSTIDFLKRDVLKDDIREYNIIEQLKNVKKHKQKEQYNNINEKNAIEFVDAINNPNFKNLFTLHSAMRLIDRYVDFESDEPYEQQCEKLIEALKTVIHIALKNGVNYETFEDVYSAKERGKKHILGPRITIPTEYFTDEARKLFKDYPLVITFCDKKNGKKGFGAISTIYSKLPAKNEK